ncbi:MAG: heme-binding protein [Limnobacter sp.]|uniref:GlcG/HbpS family heme-binding protein n=1 Tax=Limnobacter sp. TaxID=2003368 RepID=UPI0022C00AB5|nr:heme-binding protein [Limnobacter sp.]MCZ8014350.1 heme-binding protein [Limnobacter sp.]
MTAPTRSVALTIAALLMSTSLTVQAASPAAAQSECATLPTHAQLRDALLAARKADNAGFNLDMWGAVVSRSGTVCAVAFTGKELGDQWPGSRAISAQKAYTANAFSLPGLALATANLYSAVQPGGSLFGLQESNPVNTAVAMQGPVKAWGQPNDPLVGQRMGGINVFGGGLALYDSKGALLGAVGVSGDSSCADHAIAWRTRNNLKLDHVPGGVGPGGVDQIAYQGDWKQPHCIQADLEDAVVRTLPATRIKQMSR